MRKHILILSWVLLLAFGSQSLAGQVKVSPDGLNIDYFVELNGNLLLIGRNESAGWEMWKSDGTPEGTAAGTVLVKDINPGYAFSYPSYLTAANGRLFFSAFDYTNGYETWLSDGTEEGTVLMKDINPGVAGSYPMDFSVVGGALFFTATEGNNRYLWKYAPCEISDIAALSQSDCYPIYNTYTQELEITFSNPPEGGQLIVNGQPFPIGSSPQTITLAGLEADGQPVTVQAYFEEESGCSFEATALFTAPSPCNTPEEIIASMQAYIQSLIDAGLLSPTGSTGN